MKKKYIPQFFLKILFLIILFNSSSLAINSKLEKEMYLGCFSNSKQYIGSKRAKEYCVCTIEMIAKKYNDNQITEIFKKSPNTIIEKTKFASIHCEKNKKAF